MTANDLTLTTPRLILRPWQRQDLDKMAQWPAFPDPLDRMWDWPRLLQDQQMLGILWFTRGLDPTRTEWTITQHDSTVTGYLSLRDIDHAKRSSWLGLGFGAPYIGQGYGSEAMQALLAWYFGQLGFAELRLDVARHNTRALHLYQRLGFQKVRDFWQAPDLPQDWSFLSAPRYDEIRHLFRWGQDGIYMQCVEMELKDMVSSTHGQ